MKGDWLVIGKLLVDLMVMNLRKMFPLYFLKYSERLRLGFLFDFALRIICFITGPVLHQKL